LAPLEWRVASGLVAYPQAVASMESRVSDIVAGTAGELVWLVEHPALYTAGTSARDADVLVAGALPVFPTGRGGQVTYHGPGQRIAYVMLDLRRRGQDLRAFVHALEAWLIATLGRLGVRGERREGRVGIWVDRGDGREDKIAALGIRVRHWVTFHGIALNVDCDLAAYAGIVPCGVRDQRYGVTSLRALGSAATMRDVDAALKAAFDETLGAREPKVNRSA
jgi:lipoyl(octanoyl) transferase